MLWEDKVILSTLKKRAFRKDLRDQLKIFEEEIRKERAFGAPKNAFKHSSFVRKSCSQDTTDPEEVTHKTTTAGITNGAGEDLAEKQPDLNVVQEMLFTDGALDMEKLLCLHLLAKQSFINRIRRTQVPFQLPRREKRARGNATGTDQGPPLSEADLSARSPGGRYAVDLSSISFLSKKVHIAPSQPAISVKNRKKTLPQVCSVNGCCGRPEEYLERMVDSVLEALCESNPTKLCTLLQMERDEAMLSRVLSSHKVQWFMQQVCGRDMRCRKSQPMRGAKSVSELLRLERAQQLTAERQLSPEDMLKVKADVSHAEAISSGETTGTFLQCAGSATHQGTPITYSS
ncbi:uncharacterized protein LOC126354635 isoform X2 [Schistocerca gregaria]|uniref:uncharacterized protein LOC126354635 isoform X2 n=1 Tax=Schistocerca gregaria TaxID=7010 RepID=UPI00211ED728|nr:uncharacterized protein LOC126354635 isoform X2 [Schistocerca gregaria]